MTTYLPARGILDSALLGPHPDLTVRRLSSDGILAEIFPELEALHGVEQPKRWHPEGDVFEHTMLMLRHMAWPSVELGWTILLHDIGKRAAQTFGDDGVPHFYGHEAVGADMAEEILPRYGFDAEQTARIVHAVRRHMHFSFVQKMALKKVKRLIDEHGFDLELELHRIDCISSNGLLEGYVFLLDVKREYFESGERDKPAPFLRGRDLLDLGLSPGPHFSKILASAQALRNSGALKTRGDALRWLRDAVKNHPGL